MRSLLGITLTFGALPMIVFAMVGALTVLAAVLNCNSAFAQEDGSGNEARLESMQSSLDLMGSIVNERLMELSREILDEVLENDVCLRAQNVAMVHLEEEDNISLDDVGIATYAVGNYIKREGDWRQTSHYTYKWNLADIARVELSTQGDCYQVISQCGAGDCVRFRDTNGIGRWTWYDSESVRLYVSSEEYAVAIRDALTRIRDLLAEEQASTD